MSCGRVCLQKYLILWKDEECLEGRLQIYWSICSPQKREFCLKRKFINQAGQVIYLLCNLLTIL